MPTPNTIGRGVDDVYVNVQLPQPILVSNGQGFNGAASGFAGWGPINSPLTASTPSDLFTQWGPPLNSGLDLVQDGALFLKQFPLGGFIGVRVTDGTDVKATVDLQDSTPANALVLTAKYSGTLGNTIVVTLSQGSNYQTSAKTWKVVIQCNGSTETFDRIVGNTGSVVWTNIMNAINNGIGAYATPSNFVVASLPGTPSTVLPSGTAQVVTLTGGTNGGTPTTTEILGVDGGSGSRTGVYALRSSLFDIVWLAGVAATDSTGWSTLLTFAKSELAMAAGSLPVGTSVASAVSAKLTAGIDDPYFVMMLSDITFLDTYLNLQVELPATPVFCGVLCSLQPHQSPGNRVVNSILGTEQTLGTNPQPFSRADMATLEANGITFIANPIPSANAFGIRHGKNSSSNFATSEVPYGRKTNQIVRDLQGPVMGQFINRLQTTRADDPLRNSVISALDDYFGPQAQGDTPSIAAYSRVCDLTNNTPSQIAAGNLRADVQVEYLAVVDVFNINLTAGQTVTVTSAAQTIQ